MREFRNNTGSDIFVSDVGISIPIGTTTIDPENYLYWSQSTEIDTLLDSGDVTFVFEGADIDAYEAKRMIHETTDYVDVLRNSVLTRRQTKEINFTGNVLTTDDDDGKASVDIGGAGLIKGSIFPITFKNDGSSSNDYMEYHTEESDQVHAILPFECRLVAMTFANQDDGVDVDLLVVKNDFNDDAGDLEVPLSWELRNVRIASLDTFSDDIIFPAGSKIAIYMDDQGGNPDDPVVTLWFQTNGETIFEGERNYSGDFSGSGGFLANLIDLIFG